MKAPYSKKELIRDNTELESRLEQCYASNAAMEINREFLQKEVDKVNAKIPEFNELIEVNDKLRQKHSRIRKRLTEIMDKFNITYNHETKEYEIND